MWRQMVFGSRVKSLVLIRVKISRMNKEFFWALIFVGVGVAMLHDPKCRRGCRTVAEHLVSHGIDDFLASLGA